MRKALSAGALSLLVIFTMLAVAGCHHTVSDTGLTKVILQADWYPQPEHGGFYTALVKGYYKDAGLDVTIQPGGPYVSVERQVSVGEAQFGMSSSDKILESIADGQPLIAIAATMQHDPQGVMVRKDSPIKSFADLNGHSVAIKTGSTWWEFIVKRYNLHDVHEVPAMMNVANFVADPNYVQQAFATSEPFFAQQAGIATRVLLTSDAGYNPYRVMFTTRDFLAQHPEAVAGFVRASIKGWRDYLERSCLRKRRDRETESRTQSRVDAIYVAGLTRRKLRHRQRHDRRADRPNGPRALEHDVPAAARSKRDRQAVRSRHGVHPPVRAGEID